MHPDDVRERNFQWMMGPAPRLPSRYAGAGYAPGAYVGFDGKVHSPYLRREDGRITQDCLIEWAGSSGLHSAVADARLDLVLTWPKPEDVLEFGILVEELELTLDAALGLQGRFACQGKGRAALLASEAAEAIRPAVSKSPAGSCATPGCVKPAMFGRTYCDGPCRMGTDNGRDVA